MTPHEVPESGYTDIQRKILDQLDSLESQMADPDSSIWEKDKYTLRVSKAATEAIRLIADVYGKPVGDVLQDCILGYFSNCFERIPSASRDLTVLVQELDISVLELQEEIRAMDDKVAILLADEARQLGTAQIYKENSYE